MDGLVLFYFGIINNDYNMGCVKYLKFAFILYVLDQSSEVQVQTFWSHNTAPPSLILKGFTVQLAIKKH